MVTPAAKREAVAHLIESYEVSQRRACEAVGALRSVVRLRILTVVDDFTRECVALVADTSLSGFRVSRELDAAIGNRKRPAMIVSDNGTEFTSMAILRWSQEVQVDWHYIAPGKPQQNAFIRRLTGDCLQSPRGESFNESCVTNFETRRCAHRSTMPAKY